MGNEINNTAFIDSLETLNVYNELQYYQLLPLLRCIGWTDLWSRCGRIHPKIRALPAQGRRPLLLEF